MHHVSVQVSSATYEFSHSFFIHQRLDLEGSLPVVLTLLAAKLDDFSPMLLQRSHIFRDLIAASDVAPVWPSSPRSIDSTKYFPSMHNVNRGVAQDFMFECSHDSFGERFIAENVEVQDCMNKEIANCDRIHIISTKGQN